MEIYLSHPWQPFYIFIPYIDAGVFRLISARAFPAAVFSLLFIFGPLGVSGMTSWKETSTDFPSGENLATATEGQALVLGPDPSLPGNWTLLDEPAGPPPKAGHVMVYDSARRQHILFGGSYGGHARNDTWSYDAIGDRWEMREPPDAPSPRTGPAMAFSTSGNAAFLFGGNDGADQNDTWTYRLDTDRWSRPGPASSPTPRSRHALAFDTGTGSAVLFGGLHSPGPGQRESLADTWIYDPTANDWTNATAAVRPLPRYGHALAFDPANRLLVMFGGRNDSAFFPDTWTFNTTARAWTNQNPPSSPPARWGHSMAFDAVSGTVLLFGGEDSARSYNDTWAYNVSENTWTRKLLSSGPSPRLEQAMTFDPGTARALLFGGNDRAGNAQDDTWSYDSDSNSWSLKARAPRPLPRMHHAMAYSSQDRQTLLFGGTDTFLQFNDTWLFNASQGSWNRVQTPEAPSPRHDHAMAYESITGKVVLFGGLAGSEYVNETWTYNFTSGAWTLAETANAPPPGAGYQMAFDGYVGQVVLYGGRNDTELFDDTWTYDPVESVWTNTGASPSPPPRDDGMMAYDSTRYRIVLHGGSGQSGVLSDTWTFFLVSNTWTLAAPADHPPGRTDGAMAFDTASRRAVLFGGLGGLQGFNDTWTYSVLDDGWTNISPARSPAPRFGHDMVFDESSGLMVLFGGLSGGYCRAQTWALGLDGRFASGTYTSRPQATGGRAFFGSLRWESTAPAGTSVRLQLRSAMTQAELEAAPFLGPDGTAASFYTASNTRVIGAHNGSAYVQYRAYLESDDLLVTPRLRTVTLDYNLLHTLRLVSPAGGENWTGPRNVDWEVADADGDEITVELQLLDGSGSVSLAVGIPAGEGTFAWDTTDTPNGTYRIRAIARDGNAAIPLSVEATSPELTVYHPPGGPPPPPVNHPPVVLLSYPTDGSVQNTRSVRLIWNATDPDGDAMTYRVFLEVARFDVTVPPAPYCVTASALLDLTNLTNGQTYYWAVIAGDGKSNSTTEVWQFSVRLGAVNLPPRISSIPPAEATAGEEYVYQVWASDPEGDNLTYILAVRPPGMMINSTSGRLTWTPAATVRGNFTVTVNVTDGRLGQDSQTFNITVREPPSVPASVTILHPTDGWRVRGNLRITGLAVNGTRSVVSVQVRIDGGEWLTANGTTSWSLELDTRNMQNGRHTIEARGFDGTGYSALSGVGFHLNNPEPEPSLGEFQWSYLMLGLWALSGLGLFWELRAHRERAPPMT